MISLQMGAWRKCKSDKTNFPNFPEAYRKEELSTY